MEIVAHQHIQVLVVIGQVLQEILQVVAVGMLNKEIAMTKKMITKTDFDHHADIKNKNIGTTGFNETFVKTNTNRSVQIQQNKEKP